MLCTWQTPRLMSLLMRVILYGLNREAETNYFPMIPYEDFYTFTLYTDRSLSQPLSSNLGCCAATAQV